MKLWESFDFKGLDVRQWRKPEMWIRHMIPDTILIQITCHYCCVFHVLPLPLSCSPGTQLVSGGEWFGLEAALWLCLTGPLCSGRSSGRLRKRNSLFIAKWWDQNFLECFRTDLWNESHSGHDLSNSRCGSLWRMGRSAGILGGVVMGEEHPWLKYLRVWGRQGEVPVARLLPYGAGHLEQRGKDAQGAQSTSFESENDPGIGEDHTGRSWDKYHDRWVKLKRCPKLSSKRSWSKAQAKQLCRDAKQSSRELLEAPRGAVGHCPGSGLPRS